MKKAIFAGALALALLGLLPAATAPAHAETTVGESVQINIPRIKATLRLTAAQMPYWTPVESALRDLQRQQQKPDGIVRRISNRVASAVLDSATYAKLVAAARPLVKTLDEEQKMIAVQLVHEMGLGKVLASLN